MTLNLLSFLHIFWFKLLYVIQNRYLIFFQIFMKPNQLLFQDIAQFIWASYSILEECYYHSLISYHFIIIVALFLALWNEKFWNFTPSPWFFNAKCFLSKHSLLSIILIYSQSIYRYFSCWFYLTREISLSTAGSSLRLAISHLVRVDLRIFSDSLLDVIKHFLIFMFVILLSSSWHVRS